MREPLTVAGFAGSTGGGCSHAAGRSVIWTPRGEAAARAGSSPGDIVAADLFP